MRDQIIDFLRRELVGPDPVEGSIQEDGEEILMGDPPRLRYSAGVLFPRELTVEASQDLAPTETGASDPQPQDTDAPEPGESPTRQTGSGNAEPEVADETVSLSNAVLPSALGFTCFVVAPKDGLILCVRAAKYAAGMKKYVDKKGQEREGKIYLRKPLVEEIKVPYDILAKTSVTPWKATVTIDGAPSDLQVRVLVRPRKAEIRRGPPSIVTISLVNTYAAPKRPENEKCFFQVQLSARAQSGEPCFQEYPESDGEERWLDEEDRSLSLLYRHRKTYAIGHGCAAAWTEEAAGATEVRSESLPVHEVKPIVPSKLEGLDISMRTLSDQSDRTKAVSLLDLLCDKYESWIVERDNEVAASEFPEEHKKTARRHIEDCRRCLERMRSGVQLLRKDAQVLRAFQLANKAMLTQQLHYGLALRVWKPGERGELRIEPCLKPDYNNPPEGKGTWHPFQIAFLLMNLPGMSDSQNQERRVVDLIWFPTGGGKTEAYLGLTAFSILLRRIRNPRHGGTTVLMRYTLRLLTAQQFQRAASLICALESMRMTAPNELGEEPISIGLWVGKDLTPNSRQDAVASLKKLNEGKTDENPFVVLKCPWCGSQMGPSGPQGRLQGYERSKNPSTVVFRCKDSDCMYSGARRLPLTVIDEDIYENPPSLVIGTVDKFAMLPWKPQARSIFGLAPERRMPPPELIIQDELHLISGPLGSMVGHYESLIDELCTTRDGTSRSPAKIVASTATICRADEQVHALYNRKVILFPPQCLKAGDSFFAFEDEDVKGRLYVGVHASALMSHVSAQVRTIAALLQAVPSALVAREEDRDPYWTMISYFNSLRELGHAATLVRADIPEYLNYVWLRKGIRREDVPDRRRFINNPQELTSRIPSADIPKALQELERTYTGSEGHPVDICLATNMISVGVDVQRLGLMTVIGQPKTTSEYIQATSRVGRSRLGPGLVVVIYNTGKPRDRSHFERFHTYHANLYRHVEPTSVTPFASPVCERALHAVVVGFVRHLGTSANADRPQPYPDARLLEEVAGFIISRVKAIDASEIERTGKLLKYRLEQWKRVLPPRYGDFMNTNSELPLMYAAGSEPHQDWNRKAWATPTSMRNVDATTEAEVIGQYPEPGE